MKAANPAGGSVYEVRGVLKEVTKELWRERCGKLESNIDDCGEISEKKV